MPASSVIIKHSITYLKAKLHLFFFGAKATEAKILASIEAERVAAKLKAAAIEARLKGKL